MLGQGRLIGYQQRAIHNNEQRRRTKSAALGLRLQDRTICAVIYICYMMVVHLVFKLLLHGVWYCGRCVTVCPESFSWYARKCFAPVAMPSYWVCVVWWCLS